MPKTLLLTGASGFVGSRFQKLNSEQYQIKTLPWQEILEAIPDLNGTEVVVHMAALNHRMDKVPDIEYIKGNFELTKSLGEKAKADGVKHFVFLSTVKVYGESNINGRPFTEEDACHPIDAYGRSKLNAEEALRSLESESFTVSIIRSPLVYGAGVKGNMDKLIKLANTPYPLGFRGIDNQRTMVYIDNLIALVDKVIDQGCSGLFLAADDKPVSTSDALLMIRKALGKKSNLFKTPSVFLSVMGLVVPKLKSRLFDSLVFNNTNTKKRLNFQNPYTVEEGFTLMVEGHHR